MPEWWSLFVGPAAPIIGGLIGAGITAAITYFFVLKRKRVLFIVGKTESLTDALKAKGGDNVKVSINKQELDTLNRAEVLAINNGNTAISNCSFEIVLDGKHTWVTPSLNASSVLLQSAVLIKVSTVDQYSTVMFTVPFFNPKEHLAVEIFFDGKAVQPHVWCRIEDVQVRTRYGIKIDTYLDDLLPNTLWARLARAALKVLLKQDVR